MKRKIIAFLLTGSMLLQCTYSVMAAEIINEDIPAVITEEQDADAGEEQVEEISLYGADVHEENVGAVPLYDYQIDWNNNSKEYWDGIKWGDVNWKILNGGDVAHFGSLPTGWAKRVNWSQVNWNNIEWTGYNKSDIHAKYWGEICWDEVDWNGVAWMYVDWGVLKKLADESKISFSFTYKGAEDDKLTTPVSQTTSPGCWSILSNCVEIKVKGAGVAEDKYMAIPTDAYTIIVAKDGDNYKLQGIWHPILGSDYQSSQNFFDLDLNPPKIVDGVVKYPLTKSEYWTIAVDDSNCTFADDSEPLPIVTIKSYNGSVVLEEKVDYTIKDITQQGIASCGEHTLEIAAVQGSKKVAEGSVERKFTVHYADIKDFYTLEGIPTEMTVKDHIPHLTSDPNGAGKTKEQLDGYIYLEPQNNEALKAGRLPSIMDDLPEPYGSELFNSNGYLKVEYRYDSAAPGGSGWLDTFDWDDWRNNHTSNIVHIKVSVNETEEGRYPVIGNDIIQRYLKGSIYASMRVVPYSLEEVNDEPGKPKTKPTLGGTWYLAAVNPIPKAFVNPPEGVPEGAYESIDEGTIQPVVYNGEKQNPNIQVSLYMYSDIAVGGGFYAASSSNELANNPAPNITYENNINAGTGEVWIYFGGDFTGSITRYFTIEPKSIADEHVKIQAQDFLYDGNPHTPILTVTDTAINNKVLQEGTDYTVTPSGNITSPGTVTATITGKGNYKGTRTVQYKIVSTSVTVTGTKLEQVANIPAKIDGQKYTGQPVTPEVVITGKNSSMKLVKDRDYKISYLNNIESGTAYAVVEGIGNYGGTYIIPFVIGERLSQKIVVLPAQERDLKKRTLFSKPTVVKYTESPKTDTTYTSSNPNIVKVDAKTGAIEYKGIGTAVITINAAASDVYNAAIKELTVKVLPRTPKDVAVRFVAGKGIVVTGSAVPEASKYQLRIQKSGHRSVFVNIANIGALDTAYQTKSKGKFNVWVRAYKTVNGVEHFSGWTSKRTVIVK